MHRVRRNGKWIDISPDAGVGSAVAEMEPPAKTASRGEWDEYALSQGLNPDEYSSKTDLQDALEK